jgi:nicotinamidase-related amidase
MQRHPALLSRDDSLLLVVDMQEPFLNAIHGREPLTANVVLLCRVAALLGVPVLTTTQYASRMGPVAPAVLHALDTPRADGTPRPAPGRAGEPIDKLSFSCAGSELFERALTALSGAGRKKVVICGVETHICVSQTAHDLSHNGYRVHVAADAVSSRTLEKHKLGMERIRDAGILPCAAEAVVYEWLGAAGTPEFKEVLKLVK